MLVEIIEPKKQLYPFNSSKRPLVSNYRDFVLIYFKTVYRYYKPKVFRLYNTKFAFTDIYLKFSKLKLIKYLFNVYLIL